MHRHIAQLVIFAVPSTISLGLLTIVNLLREEYDVSLKNENIQRIDYTDKPDIVGISVTVDTLSGAVRIA